MTIVTVVDKFNNVHMAEIDSVTWINFSDHMATFALVSNLSIRWHHLVALHYGKVSMGGVTFAFH